MEAICFSNLHFMHMKEIKGTNSSPIKDIENPEIMWLSKDVSKCIKNIIQICRINLCISGNVVALLSVIIIFSLILC